MANKSVWQDLVIRIAVTWWWMGIFLSHQANAFCPHLCHCDDLRMVVTCPAESKLDVIPITLNPNLKELHLKDNKIRTVDASFQFYGQLEYVDFSKNEMSHLPQRCFASQKKLLKLKMDGNKIANITNATFVGLKSLRSISFRDNILGSLQENLFVFLTKLDVLNLGGNQLTDIHKKAFTKLINLRVLYLDNNLLASIPSDSFKPLTNLQKLFLGGPGNTFHTLADDAFRYLSSIKSLDLGNSDVLNISENAFRGKIQHTIKVLNMSHNLLDQLPSSQLSQLASLEQLYIGGNSDIQQISENSFPLLRRLELIDISYSYNLEKIESFAFRDNTNLQTIILDGNTALSSDYSDGRGIKQNAFTIMPSPSAFTLLSGEPKKNRINLKMRSMQLSYINSDIMENWEDLNSIDLSGNSLHCDCKLLWLHRILIAFSKEAMPKTDGDKNNSIIFRSSSVPCVTPAVVENLQLSLVPKKDMESCDNQRTLSLPGIKTTHAQLILILVCVSCAVFTGILIFVAVHCSGRYCSFGETEASNMHRKCLPNSMSSTTTSTSTSSYSADSLKQNTRCRCCTISLTSCKHAISRCSITNILSLCCRKRFDSSNSSSPSSTYEITSCCTLRCCHNDRNILNNNDQQFRSSIYDNSSTTNHYTFGRTSYYVNNDAGNARSNPQNFQQNVNMTLNLARPTPLNEGGFTNMIHPLPLSLSAVEASLNHHLCQSRSNQNHHPTLLMPRSCSNDHTIEGNNWYTQKKNQNKNKVSEVGYQNMEDVARARNYTVNDNSQRANTIYQDINTCRYDPHGRQIFDLPLHVQNHGTILPQSSNPPFLLSQETPTLSRLELIENSAEVNPYAVPGEQYVDRPAFDVLHSNQQTCLNLQTNCKTRESHYQNISRNDRGRSGDARNTYSTRSRIDQLDNRIQEDREDICDIWQRDTRNNNGESPRTTLEYNHNSPRELYCQTDAKTDLSRTELISPSAAEELTNESMKSFRQHKPRSSTAEDESCDSGDYFVSLSKDMKTMKTIPVSEL